MHKASLVFRALKLVADLSSLLAVLLGSLWAWAYRAAGVDGVKLVGDVQAEGLIVGVPGKGYYDTLLGDSTLFVSAAVIAIVGFLESVAVGGKFANMSKYIFDPNQELLALGVANFVSSFMSGFPVTGGFSRSAVSITLCRAGAAPKRRHVAIRSHFSYEGVHLWGPFCTETHE